MEGKKDYLAQQKHLRSNYVRFSLDLRPAILEEFKRICAERGTTPTTQIKKFISEYCARSGGDEGK